MRSCEPIIACFHESSFRFPVLPNCCTDKSFVSREVSICVKPLSSMDKNTDTSTAKQRIIFENERTKEMYELFIVTHTNWGGHLVMITVSI